MFDREVPSNYESSSRILIDNEDVALISDSFECREKSRMTGAPWYKRLVYFVASLTRQVLWHPRNCDAYHKLQALKWIRTYLTHCLSLVQQIANLRHARTEFERMKVDLMHDRSLLKEDMESTKSQLGALHCDYHKNTQMGEPTYTLASDANLLLGDFQRYRDLYRLYNDIINLVSKTLVDTNRIEKLAFLCGTVRKSDVFVSDGYKCFEETLYQLLGQVAECDKTKEYINGQLSIAKNSNLDAALSAGIQTERDNDERIMENFLNSGKICLEPVGLLTREELPTNLKTNSSYNSLQPKEVMELSFSSKEDKVVAK